MIDRKDWPVDARNAQDAFDEASWDAIEGYRDTGEMVPGMKDGKLYLYTVDGEWRRNNLIAQFKAAGLELTPDVWERLAADRRQALEDDLAWIHP